MVNKKYFISFINEKKIYLYIIYGRHTDNQRQQQTKGR